MRSTNPKGLVGVVMTILVTASASADLAITEIGAEASGFNGTNVVDRGPDWLEITNHGTNRVDVAGYHFNDDSNATDLRHSDVFGEDVVAIAPGESVVLFRVQSITINTVAEFKEWWGLAQEIRVYGYTASFGFSNDECVFLWDGENRLIDKACLGKPDIGSTVIPDPDTGLFGATSRIGQGNAFRATTADDVGSPGFAPDRIEIFWIDEPEDQTACVESTFVFSALAGGVPQAQYQWFKDGNLINGATERVLTIPNVQPEDAGNYSLMATNNCLEFISSRVARLQISTEPFPLIVYKVPEDVEVFPGQKACFEAVVDACPAPTFQWFQNEGPISGATDPLLAVNATMELSGTVYAVEVTKNGMTNRFAATLTVSARPELRVTEVMSWPMADPLHQDVADWVEVTNIGTNAANLRGYRIADDPEVATAFPTSPNADVIIEPGESVVFVRRMTPDEFRELWGEDRLPPCLDIVTFDGFGLNNELGETVHFWNPGCVRAKGDFVTASTFRGFIDFPEERGRSWRCGTIPGNSDFCVELSVLNEDGAWKSKNGDIGTPGYSEFSPDPCSQPTPLLLSVPDHTVRVGDILLVTNLVDLPDSSCRLLSFNLEGTPPTGALIRTNTGLFFWRPQVSQAGTTHSITVRVANRRCPSLNSTVRFSVVVEDYAEISLGHTAALTGGMGSLPLDLFASVDVDVVRFALDYPANTITDLGLSFSPGVDGEVLTESDSRSVVTLSNFSGQPFRDAVRLAELFFNVPPGPSRVAVIGGTEVVVTMAGGSPLMDAGAKDGSVVMVGEKPLLRATLLDGERWELTVFGIPGTTYQLEVALGMAGPWTSFGTSIDMPDDDLVRSLVLPFEISNPEFYRAKEIP